jgi:hypothetical protein
MNMMHATKKGRTWGIPVGCIPEKITRGDSDFVETFRDEGCPGSYVVHALPARPVLSKLRRGVKNLSGKWTRRISDSLERARGCGQRPEGTVNLFKFKFKLQASSLVLYAVQLAIHHYSIDG